MFRKQRPPVGATPGDFGADNKGVRPVITAFDYSADVLKEAANVTDFELLAEYRRSKPITWIDVQGLGDHDILKRIAEVFDIHPLAIADVVNIPSRPKVEEYDEKCLIIVSAVQNAEPAESKTEQIAIIMGPTYVITFQEHYSDLLEPIRKRIRQGKGQIRTSGSDYLTYAILDAIIDGYYPVLESLGERLELIEDETINNPTRESLEKIYQVRREMITLRRLLWPLREIIVELLRDETKHFKKSVQVYLRDCYDHVVQMIDVIENYRELCGSLMDVYLSGISNRMNEIMKVLTIISTIFIPLSFFAGVYGMNFRYMPELDMPEAYPTFWILILLAASAMLLFFKRRGWLDGTSQEPQIRKKAPAPSPN